MNDEATTRATTCPKCGKVVDADGRFCKYCAFDLAQAEQRSQTTNSPQRFCPYCGESVGENAVFCGNCGETLSKEQERATVIEEKPRAISRNERLVPESQELAQWEELAKQATSQKERQIPQSPKGNGLLVFAVLVLVGSGLAFLWGYQYISTHQLAGFATAFGYNDPTYSVANGALIVGALGFVLGIGLLIGGLVKKAS